MVPSLVDTQMGMTDYTEKRHLDMDWSLASRLLLPRLVHGPAERHRQLYARTTYDSTCG